MNNNRIFFLLLMAFGFAACNTTESNPPCPNNNTDFTLSVNHSYNMQSFALNSNYISGQDNPLWFTTKDYYLSNIKAIQSDGSAHLLTDIAFISLADSNQHLITNKLPTGDYTGFEVSLGVDSILNNQDPVTWDPDHPLSVYNNMYWTWATMYIFAKLEGFEVHNNDTIPFYMHVGTNPLYRANLFVDHPFTLSTGGGQENIEIDIYQILNQPGYTFNLTVDGKTHTMDNMPLAVQYMDNFSNVFK